VADIPDVVDLETEGTLDWAHWGLSGVNDVNRKAGVTNVISDYTTIGTPTTGHISTDDSLLMVSWTNGTPTDSADEVRAGLYFPFELPIPVDEGISLSIPAELNEYTLNLYIGVFRGNAKLTATLNGAAPLELTISNLENTPIVRKVTLNFGAATAGDPLDITFAVQDSPEASNISLHAATLFPAKVAAPVITPPNGLFAGPKAIDITSDTPGATIRYTTDGSEPNADSPVFTAGDLTLSENTTVRAKAFVAGFADSDIASGDFTIVGAANTIKEAFIEKAPDIVNLDNEGNLDWAHWGLDSVDDFNHKAGVTNVISDFTTIGTVTPVYIHEKDSNFAASWANGSGTPDLVANAARTGLYFPFSTLPIPTTDGIQITVGNQDTAEKVLRLYIGSFSGNGKLTASLNGSDDFETIVENPNPTPIAKVVEIRYVPLDAADDITLVYTPEDNPHSLNISLHAATLSN
jgi:hypothetical protein